MKTYNFGNNDTWKWVVAFVLIGLLCFGLAFSLLPGIQERLSSDEDTKTEVDSSASDSSEDSDAVKKTAESVSLFSSPVVVTGANYESQTVTAVITPSDAKDKRIEWSIAWSSEFDEPISDYYDLSTSQVNGTEAVVKCFAEAPIAAVITATHISSGLTTSCSVQYLGKPTQLEVSPVLSFDVDEDGCYLLPWPGEEVIYTFNLDYSNAIGGSIMEDIQVQTKLSATGSFGTFDCYYFPDTGTLIDAQLGSGIFAVQDVVHNFVKLSYDSQDKTIDIDLTGCVESFVGEICSDSPEEDGSILYRDVFEAYEDDNVVICITISTEGKTVPVYNLYFKIVDARVK